MQYRLPGGSSTICPYSTTTLRPTCFAVTGRPLAEDQPRGNEGKTFLSLASARRGDGIIMHERPNRSPQIISRSLLSPPLRGSVWAIVGGGGWLLKIGRRGLSRSRRMRFEVKPSACMGLHQPAAGKCRSVQERSRAADLVTCSAEAMWPAGVVLHPPTVWGRAIKTKASFACWGTIQIKPRSSISRYADLPSPNSSIVAGHRESVSKVCIVRCWEGETLPSPASTV